MSNKSTLNPIAAALGVTFAVAFAASPIVSASENPFSLTEFSNGYLVAEAGEGKCGEGKCGAAESESEKASEGKCGEGKCGGDKPREAQPSDEKSGEGKCGEGKCGSQA